MIVHRPLSIALIGNCSVSDFALLVRMDFVQKRTLDCPDNSIRSLGMVLLYFDLDDVHLH